MLWILCMMNDANDDEYSKQLFFEDAEDALEKAFSIHMTGYDWEQCGKPDYMELVGIYNDQLLDYLNNDDETTEKAYARWEDMKELALQRNEVSTKISPAILNGTMFTSVNKDTRQHILS